MTIFHVDNGDICRKTVSRVSGDEVIGADGNPFSLDKVYFTQLEAELGVHFKLATPCIGEPVLCHHKGLFVGIVARVNPLIVDRFVSATYSPTIYELDYSAYRVYKSHRGVMISTPTETFEIQIPHTFFLREDRIKYITAVAIASGKSSRTEQLVRRLLAWQE